MPGAHANYFLLCGAAIVTLFLFRVDRPYPNFDLPHAMRPTDRVDRFVVKIANQGA